MFISAGEVFFLFVSQSSKISPKSDFVANIGLKLKK